MKERPILFNAEMVNAILSGRKTQTRRIMKNQPAGDFVDCPVQVRQDGDLFQWFSSDYGQSSFFSCPLGEVGDRLWVREKTRLSYYLPNNRAYVRYEADGETATVDVPARIKHIDDGKCLANGCYREASRITLEITGVRVERLASISDDDARREGYPADPQPYGGSHDKWLWFRQLWDGIYPEQSFKVNPWVWVIEFKRVEQPHDQ